MFLGICARPERRGPVFVVGASRRPTLDSQRYDPTQRGGVGPAWCSPGPEPETAVGAWSYQQCHRRISCIPELLCPRLVFAVCSSHALNVCLVLIMALRGSMQTSVNDVVDEYCSPDNIKCEYLRNHLDCIHLQILVLACVKLTSLGTAPS